MRKLFTLTMLISFAMICSCQKQDSAAERQLAQRKAELDTREKALDEREKALAEREKATTNIRRTPAGVQGRIADPAQLKAERAKRIQQLPPDVQKLIPDPAQVHVGSISCGRGHFPNSVADSAVSPRRYLRASSKSRQIRALLCEIPSVSERVDGIDVLVAPNCLNS